MGSSSDNYGDRKPEMHGSSSDNSADKKDKNNEATTNTKTGLSFNEGFFSSEGNYSDDGDFDVSAGVDLGKWSGKFGISKEGDDISVTGNAEIDAGLWGGEVDISVGGGKYSGGIKGKLDGLIGGFGGNYNSNTGGWGAYGEIGVGFDFDFPGNYGVGASAVTHVGFGEDEDSHLTLDFDISIPGYSAKGSVDISLDLDPNLAREFGYPFPLILDLDGDGVETIGSKDSNAFFNFGGSESTAPGTNQEYVAKTGWVGSDDGILVYDFDDSNTVNDPFEIVFTKYLQGAKTDLEGLRGLDDNKDGKLDDKDKAWAKFKIWQDKNQNGIVDQGEMVAATAFGLAFINLIGDGKASVQNGNLIAQHAEYGTIDGQIHQVGDVGFGFELQLYERGQVKDAGLSSGNHASGQVEVNVSNTIINAAPALEEVHSPVTYQDGVFSSAPTPSGSSGTTSPNQVGGGQATPSGGSAATSPASGGGESGHYVFIPDEDFNGEASFDYWIRDEAGNVSQASAKIDIRSVNDDPIAREALYVTMKEDGTRGFTLDQLLKPILDKDGDVLSIGKIMNVTGGTITQSNNGGYVFTGAKDYNGIGGFAYEVSDGKGGKVIQYVTVNIEAVNDLPSMISQPRIMEEDKSLSFKESDLLQGASDIDGDVLSVTGISNVKGGHVEWVAPSGGMQTSPQASGVASAQGALHFNYAGEASGAATSEGANKEEGGQYVFIADKDYNGIGGFAYEVSDGKGGVQIVHVTASSKSRFQCPASR